MSALLRSLPTKLQLCSSKTFLFGLIITEVLHEMVFHIFCLANINGIRTIVLFAKQKIDSCLGNVSTTT